MQVAIRNPQESYAFRRAEFRTAVLEAGGRFETYTNHYGRGIEGEQLTTDTAWIGPQDSDTVIVLVSGTHGIEGFAGSMCQANILGQIAQLKLPPGVATLFIHGLNPFGMSYLRRVNELNVDLNRNFVDHRTPPRSDDYDLVHSLLVPDSWTGPARIESDQALAELVVERGARNVQHAITGGQWIHPNGLFYGGSSLSWSAQTLYSICSQFLSIASDIRFVDIHTGLGRRGEAELIFRGGLDSDARVRSSTYFGELTDSDEGSACSTPISGNTASAVASQLLPHQELSAITLEIGTRPGIQVLNALRGDNWVWLNKSCDLSVRRAVRSEMLEAFFPDDEDWAYRVPVIVAKVFWRAAYTARYSPNGPGAPQ